MNNDVIAVLTHRLELVHRRLDALNKESETLNHECTSLTDLVNVYISRKGYDPIEEERRVTDRILNPTPAPTPAPKPAKSTNTVGRTRNTGYDAAMELIFEDNNNTPLTLTELTGKLQEYTTDNHILVGTVWGLVRSRLKSGMLRVAKIEGNSRYFVYDKSEAHK